MSTFEELFKLDVNEHLDKKNGLSYLSWAWAWGYFKKAYPDAKYQIKEWEGKPYLFDEKTGYMVQTSITAGEETHTMWLPVMDSTNHAMKDKPYQLSTKYNKPIDVKAADMFDINKTIMRCLVKNMAMFGLGLYIYAGEDLPEAEDKPIEIAPLSDEYKNEIHSAKTLNELRNVCREIMNKLGTNYTAPILKEFNAREKELNNANIQSPAEK